MCKYKTEWGWECPFEPDPGKELCIFHLPLDQKEPKEFYKHLANYLLALYEKNQTPKSKNSWIGRERDEKLLDHYLRFVTPEKVWRFTGFVFPAMDEPHNFMGFNFPMNANFSEAEFQNANFSRAKFQNANFSEAKFQNADFSRAEFHQTAAFFAAKFHQNAYFSLAKFRQYAYFFAAEFQNADFSRAEFQNAHFSEAKFQNADFSRAEFHQTAAFFAAEFQNAHFSWTKFRNANFSEAKFQNADFGWAEFHQNANFSRAKFQNANFRWAKFDGPVYFNQTEINGNVDFTGARLRNRLLFEGTKIGENGLILLWDLDFVHGVSHITLRDSSASLGMTGGKQGQIVEPAGQVVFKDIEKNMNRVSFLHSEIFSDRLYIRFSNVKWEKERPERFIYDANFVFNPKEEKWRELIKDEELDRLCRIFNLPTGSEQKVDFNSLRELVTADVERIAREIRRSTEEYGSYSDAGDYYIAEMDYRRRKPSSKWFERFVLTLYNWVSRYGESPGLALRRLAEVWIFFANLYFWFGFNFGRRWDFLWTDWTDTGKAFLYPLRRAGWALIFGLVNIVPGYFRFQIEPPGRWYLVFFMIVQALLGITILALFLLAIRRRFSR